MGRSFAGVHYSRVRPVEMVRGVRMYAGNPFWEKQTLNPGQFRASFSACPLKIGWLVVQLTHAWGHLNRKPPAKLMPGSRGFPPLDLSFLLASRTSSPPRQEASLEILPSFQQTLRLQQIPM